MRRSLFLAALLAATVLPAQAHHDREESRDTAPDPALTPEQKAARRELALHCIAVEKDGVAIDPWIFLHGPNGRRSAGFFTPRTSWSLQGRGVKGYLTTGRQVFSQAQWKQEEEFGPYLPLRACIQQMFRDARARNLQPLVFVHGGNNALDGAVARAEQLSVKTKDIEAAGYYPIFLCWNSAIPSTWGESIVHVRNGVDLRSRPAFQQATYGWLLSPLYLATDLASGVIHAPVVGIDNFISTLHGSPTIAGKWSVDHRDSSRRYLNARTREFAQANQYAAALGLDPDGSGRAAAVGLRESEEALAGRVRSSEDARESFSRRWSEHWLPRRQALFTGKQLPAGAPSALGRAPLVVSMGDFSTTVGDRFTRVLGWCAGLPSKAAVLAALTGGGEHMWAMMNRRVDTMFPHRILFPARWAAGRRHDR